MSRLHGCVTRGLDATADDRAALLKDLQAVRAVAATVDAKTDPVANRQATFAQLQRRYAKDASPTVVRMSEVMARWEPGLFVGEATVETQADADLAVSMLPEDNLALERWFKLPKHHARHVHGRAHAGIALVHRGPTLMLVLDAHQHHDGPFTREHLCQRASERTHRGRLKRTQA